MPKSRTILRNLTMSRLTSRGPAQADLDEPVELIRKLDVAVLDRLQRDLLPRLVPVHLLRGRALARRHLPEFRDEILQTRIALRRAQIFRAQCAFFHVALPLHEVTPADRLADERAGNMEESALRAKDLRASQDDPGLQDLIAEF